MSVFREALLFLNDIGVYDVVLPLLLIFSIVFAILEKTRVFGEEKIGGEPQTRKNINAMVAFVAGFFVVASAQLVGTIHKLIADVSLVLVTFVMFMILLGVFSKDEGLVLKGGWRTTFMIIAFVSITLIFMNALGWLQLLWEYLAFNWNSELVAVIALFGVMVAFIIYITKSPKPKKDD